jgi:RimJ/RimL family protein N-acetyltransferase
VGELSTVQPDERVVDLGRGRVLTVRAVRPDDVDALVALYDGLDADARYRRFFCAYRPRRPFFEQMATVADRGGAGLVAVLATADGPPQLVAEAGYVPLPNGDGELALAVAAAWRGWLGPYLVDALATVAAARGVPNLEADVLVTNGPMLAVLRARGCVVMDHPDWSTVRLLIGTGTGPTWPRSPNRPRVLVEGSAGRWRSASGAAGRRAQVLYCPGPTVRPTACAARTGRPCPLAGGADLVVLAPPDDSEPWRALRAAHADLHPAVPVCLLASGGRPGETAAPADDRDGPTELAARLELLGAAGPATDRPDRSAP